MTKEKVLKKAKEELSNSIYMTECGSNGGLRKIHENRIEWLAPLVTMAEEGLYNSVNWINPTVLLPENLPENNGRKSIPCLVCVKSRYPKGKPNIEKRMRQYSSWYGRWEWSKLRGDDVVMWAPMPYPKEYR